VRSGRFVILFCVVGCLLVAGARLQAQESQQAQQAEEPAKSKIEISKPRPDYKDLEQIRFLTDSDYPPFNYFDDEGSLTGFNVDLARAICDELIVECDIAPVNWEELVPALKRGDANAVIASIRPSKKTLDELDFSESYYHTPARFIGKRDEEYDLTPTGLKGKKIGVVKGSAHEVFLRDFFPDAKLLPYERAVASMLALKQGAVDLTFGDGISMMFWVNGTASERCCAFAGGSYLEAKYFGEGVGIAVKRGDRKMRKILDYGLERVRKSGRYEELLLRYFPLRLL
jgi:polar amino acid transport system substrate-binding protein